MSKDIDELRNRFFPSKKDDTVFQCVVTEVDETDFTCTVRRDDSVDYFDVRLRSIVNADLTGFSIIPKTNSTVLVARINGSNELFVCQFSEVDKIIFTSGENGKIGFLYDNEKTELKRGDKVCVTISEDLIKLVNDKSTVEISGSEITFNGGDLGAMVVIDRLKSNLDSLKKYVEAIHNALPPAFSAVGVAMAANGALGATTYNSTMAGKIILFEDMADEKVKH